MGTEHVNTVSARKNSRRVKGALKFALSVAALQECMAIDYIKMSFDVIVANSVFSLSLANFEPYTSLLSEGNQASEHFVRTYLTAKTEHPVQTSATSTNVYENRNIVFLPKCALEHAAAMNLLHLYTTRLLILTTWTTMNRTDVPSRGSKHMRRLWKPPAAAWAPENHGGPKKLFHALFVLAPSCAHRGLLNRAMMANTAVRNEVPRTSPRAVT